MVTPTVILKRRLWYIFLDFMFTTSTTSRWPDRGILDVTIRVASSSSSTNYTTNRCPYQTLVVNKNMRLDQITKRISSLKQYIKTCLSISTLLGRLLVSYHLRDFLTSFHRFLFGDNDVLGRLLVSFRLRNLLTSFYSFLISFHQ